MTVAFSYRHVNTHAPEKVNVRRCGVGKSPERPGPVCRHPVWAFGFTDTRRRPAGRFRRCRIHILLPLKSLQAVLRQTKRGVMPGTARAVCRDKMPEVWK